MATRALTVYLYLLLVACAAIEPALQSNTPSPLPDYAVRIIRLSGTGKLLSICSGVATSKNTVLTAKHCITSAGGALFVLRGKGEGIAADRFTQAFLAEILSNQDSIYEPLSVHAHPTLDIALIETPELPIDNPIKISSEPITRVNSDLSYTGYGLHKGKIGQRFIGKIEVVYVEPHVFWVTSSGEGLCRGDSGAGVFFDSILVGIVSAGSARCDLSDKVTKTHQIQSWLNEIKNSD